MQEGTCVKTDSKLITTTLCSGKIDFHGSVSTYYTVIVVLCDKLTY